MKKLLFGLMAFASFAACAASFSYQGVLRDAQGKAIAEKNQTIAFRLYAEPTGGAALWGRSVAVRLDDDGLFNVELSDTAGSPLDEDLPDSLESVLAANGNATLYIGLTVSNSSGEIRPRQKVLAVPVAAFAQDVSLARNNFTVTGLATVNGGLTVLGDVELRGTNTVRSLSVESDATFAGTTKVTGALNLMGGKLEMPAGADFTIGGKSAVIPSGVIVMWSGSAENIPSGWVLCNGKNGAPDLRDRFIVGAGGGYAVGATGGAATVTLTVAQMPSHTHDVKAKAADLVAAWKDHDYFFDFSEHYNNPRTTTTTATGGNQPHENRPPYYALCFIMKQ